MKGGPTTGIVEVKPGKAVRLGEIDASDTGQCGDKDEAELYLARLHEKLLELQTALYAEGRQALLIVLQAMDTGGKDGATKALMSGVNPTGVRVTSFKQPNALELGHDFLWRVHAQVPPRGYIGVWNRSHYEDVLVVRVHGQIGKKVCRERYERINDFEKLLSQNDVTVLKFFLHISKDEQKERLRARLDDPDKLWKFNVGDLKERAYWNDYQEAYEDALNACSTGHSPWYIVPANHKWARDLAIAETVVSALKKLKPSFPAADFDPRKVRIR